MDKYLQEILLAHLSVILPEFGALSLNEETKTVVFNPFVTYNDEKFESFLVEKHNIEKQAAANMVAQYVKEIQNHVNKGENFIIFKFGRFTKSKDDAVEFQNWSEFNTQTTSEKKVESPTPIEEKKEVTETIEKVTEPEVIADKSEKITEEKKKNTYISGDEKLAKTDVVSEKEKSVEKEIPKEKVIAKKETPKKVEKPVKAPKPPKPPKEKKERKKRSAFFYINIVLLLLLITGGVLVGLNYSKVQQFLGFAPKAIEHPAALTQADEENDVNEEPEVIESKEIVSEENKTDDEKNEKTQKSSTPPIVETAPEKEAPPTKTVEKTNSYASSSGSFHIIGGGFADPANAERFAKSLQEKGMSAQVIGVFDGLSLVSLQSFPSLQEAKDALSNVASQGGINKAWIFKH